MNPTYIHLVRHGEVHNPDHVLYGRLPRFQLSRRGFRQAAMTAAFLKTKPIEAVFSSPLLRARQTAKSILSYHNGLKLRISGYINEVHSAYEGRPGAEVDARNGDLYSDGADGFEKPRDLVNRVQLFLLRVLKHHGGGEVVGVTHGDIIVFTVLWARGFDLSPVNKTRLEKAGYAVAYPEHASITTLTFNHDDLSDRPRIDYFNPAAQAVV